MDEISEEQVEASAPAAPKRSRRRTPWIVAGLTVGLLLVGFNLTVWAPVALALHKDERNRVAGIHVYRSWFVHPRDITINLATVGEAATVDLTRELFQAAAALKGRKFGKITLARGAKALFVMRGKDFAELGDEFDAGQNPVYLARTLPEKLYLPSGGAAFGTWEGGWIGVVGKQFEDINTFGRAWVTGQAPPASPSN